MGVPMNFAIKRTSIRGCVNVRPYRALTLIELLVVIGIIGLLLGMMLPAVQSVREAGRRAGCVANMRQIGIAMQSYYSMHNMFPPSQLHTGTNWTMNYISELSFLLPYIEQQPLYSSINMTFANTESPDFPLVDNHTARNTPVAIYLCPSDGDHIHLNSYRFNRGRYGIKRAQPYDGPFSLGVLPSQTTVTDGLARTAFMSERIAGSFARGGDGPLRDIKLPVANGELFASDAQFIPFCLAAPVREWVPTAGRYWYFGGFYNSHYNHNGSPNDPRPTCEFKVTPGGTYGLHPPRSYHPGAVNVLFGDGHVEAVLNSVDQRVWVALGTYDAGD